MQIQADDKKQMNDKHFNKTIFFNML